MRTSLHFGGFEGSFPAVAAPLSIVVTTARPQAADALPGAFFGAAFALLNPPLAGDLLHAVPFLPTTAESEGNQKGGVFSGAFILFMSTGRWQSSNARLNPWALCPTVSTGKTKLKII